VHVRVKKIWNSVIWSHGSLSLGLWLVLLVELSVTLFAWHTTNRQAEVLAERRFEKSVESITGSIKRRLEDYEQVMRGGVGLMAASDRVSREAWRQYFVNLQLGQSFPGIQGLGYSKIIRPHELDEHIREIRAEGFPDYTVKPAGRRDVYTSIIYLEPFRSRNLRAFGYDMYSEAVRRAAMDHARETGSMAISGKVTLVQENGQDPQFGLLMYLPVYAKGFIPESVTERHADIIGYVYSVYRIKDLMNGIFSGNNRDVNFTLFEGAKTNEDMLYDYAAARRLPVNANPRYVADKSLDIHGTKWNIRVSSLREFEAAVDYSKSRIILVSGLLVTVLIFAFMAMLSVSRRRALTIAESSTHELMENEKRIRAVLENVVDGIISISECGRIESINPAGERIFGYRAEELVGKNVKVLMPEPYHSAHDGFLCNYRETRNRKIIGIGREVIGQRKDGTIFPLDLAVGEVQLDGGLAFTGIVRDVTERKASEREHRETMALQRAILDSANYTIISTDVNGLILTFNKAAERMLGYAADEMVGKLTPGILHDPQEVARRAQELSAELGRDIQPGFEVFIAKARVGLTDENEWTYTRKDSSRYPVMLSVTALLDPSGSITGYLGIGYDMTERKEMDRIKDEFVSTASHELRTPLTSIMGSLGLIAGGIGGELPAQAKSLIDIACANASRLVRLTNDMLDIHKMESGKMRFDPRVQELMPLVVEAVETSRNYAGQFGVRIEFVQELHGVKAEVDADRLSQVLANLLSNAVKFSPGGSSISVKVGQVDGFIRISVADQGPGIPPEFRSRIFQKFCQADASNTRQQGGTGLGLSISKAIVEQMGGRIGFESSTKHGTVFHVDLPDAGMAPSSKVGEHAGSQSNIGVTA